MTARNLIYVALAVVSLSINLAQSSGSETIAVESAQEVQRQGGGNQRRVATFPESAWKPASFILGRPTSNSVSLTIHARQELSGNVTVLDDAGKKVFESSALHLNSVTPTDVEIVGLKPGASYRYQFVSSSDPSESSPGYSFTTQRPRGTSFSFAIQGDSHPERTPKMHVPALYERTLLSALSAKPDFMICMGDDFSIDTVRELNESTVRGAYARQVPYLGLLAHSVPLFLVNGNHEQASKANLDGSSDNPAVWAQKFRNQFFPQPAPDGFYGGNDEKVEHIGLLRNYFYWNWGDALFVVIDPYWHSDSPVDNSLATRDKQKRDLWNNTLGETQYRWLAKTLKESKAKFKFVFAHHVHGTGRGGVEQAHLYEWGGKSPNGRDEFATRRPGWDLPIHQLFVAHGVTAFFQGHDHLYAKQELDGVVYQTTPTPADASMTTLNADAYRSGEKVAGAGVLLVTVGGETATVEFRRSYLPDQEVEGLKQGEVAHKYQMTPRKGEQE